MYTEFIDFTDFKDKNLSGSDFSGKDLTGVSFWGSNLSNCNFKGAILNYANLRETTIENTNFTDAEMHFCNSKDAVGTADFTNAKIYGMPRHILTPGADETAPLKVERVIEEVFTQSKVEISDANTDTIKILSQWKVGDGGDIEITEILGLAIHGRELYIAVYGEDESHEVVDLSIILNEIMKKNIDFDRTTKLFIST